MIARLITCALLSLGATQAHASDTKTKTGDAEAGAALYDEVCASCHGPSGRGMASYPKLAGNSADYLSDRLETYRAGERVGPNSMLMIPNAQDLSDEDIADLSVYLAGL